MFVIYVIRSTVRTFAPTSPPASDQTDSEEVDPAEQFDIDFAVMAGELSSLLTDIAQIVESPQSLEAVAARSKVA